MTATVTPRNRYHAVSIALHWAMLGIFITVYASIELRELFEKGTEMRGLFKNAHFTAGLLILALVWIRIAARLMFPAPVITPAPTKGQALAAKIGHLVLYAFMIGMPIAGWLMLSAYGSKIPFFGIEMPALIGTDKGLASQIKELHELGGTIGYLLIAAHAAAALYHHYIKRDDTLKRMY